MKKLIVTLMIAFAITGIVSCSDKDENGNDITSLNAIVENTSWEGTYNTYITSPYTGQTPMDLTWTLDFNEDGKGFVVLDVQSEAIDAVTTEGEMTYTYDGMNHGTINYEILSTTTESNFQIDAINRTMTVELTFVANHEEGGPYYTYGGKTTLRQIR